MPSLRVLLAAILICLLPNLAPAVQPDEILPDASLEARARALTAQLRCMVCQNQSIDDSDAGVARDLRILVRERIVAGDSDAQVIDYLVTRYGEFVLLKPRMTAQTFLLWAAPGVVLLVGAIAFFGYSRRRLPAAEAGALTAEEREKIAALLKPEK